MTYFVQDKNWSRQSLVRSMPRTIDDVRTLISSFIATTLLQRLYNLFCPVCRHWLNYLFSLRPDIQWFTRGSSEFGNKFVERNHQRSEIQVISMRNSIDCYPDSFRYGDDVSTLTENAASALGNGVLVFQNVATLGTVSVREAPRWKFSSWKINFFSSRSGRNKSGCSSRNRLGQRNNPSRFIKPFIIRKFFSVTSAIYRLLY